MMLILCDRVHIIFSPNKLNPLNISLTVKLIKLFEQEGIIMNTEFNDTKPPFIFRPSNQILGRKVITFTLKIPSPL
jgi:hypothetical protein